MVFLGFEAERQDGYAPCVDSDGCEGWPGTGRSFPMRGSRRQCDWPPNYSCHVGRLCSLLV